MYNILCRWILFQWPIESRSSKLGLLLKITLNNISYAISKCSGVRVCIVPSTCIEMPPSCFYHVGVIDQKQVNTRNWVISFPNSPHDSHDFMGFLGDMWSNTYNMQYNQITYHANRYCFFCFTTWICDANENHCTFLLQFTNRVQMSWLKWCCRFPRII